VRYIGQVTQGFGELCQWGGDLLSKYGFAGSLLSGGNYGANKYYIWRNKITFSGKDVNPLDKGMESIGRKVYSCGAGLALDLVGKPINFLGYKMQTRDWQCNIGNMLNFGSTWEVPKEEM
jgi:hypothetical protein